MCVPLIHYMYRLVVRVHGQTAMETVETALDAVGAITAVVSFAKSTSSSNSKGKSIDTAREEAEVLQQMITACRAGYAVLCRDAADDFVTGFQEAEALVSGNKSCCAPGGECASRGVLLICDGCEQAVHQGQFLVEHCFELTMLF